MIHSVFLWFFEKNNLLDNEDLEIIIKRCKNEDFFVILTLFFCTFLIYCKFFFMYNI